MRSSSVRAPAKKTLGCDADSSSAPTNETFQRLLNGNAAFVAAMEDVLDVYHRPRDPACPLVCLDETSKQLIKERACRSRRGLARTDYEYERNGTANIFGRAYPGAPGQARKVATARTAAW